MAAAADSEKNKQLKQRDDKIDLRNAQKIFQQVFDRITEDLGGRDKLIFPKEIMWLGGAPGAGKGTNTPFINRVRDITAPPIVMSDLLNTPEMEATKNQGQLVGDADTFEILVRELLKPRYESGVVVDGFPRTKVQVECVRLFYNKMMELRREFFDTPIGPQFRRPIFRITILYVREDVSVKRQLKRGHDIQEHNQRVRETGEGKEMPVRETDLNENLARARYEVFKNQTFDALNSLRDSFHYHFIDANRPIEEVEQSIEEEFAYQSSLELGEDTFDSIHNIPTVSQLTAHTRYNLVKRLDNYRHRHAELFAQVIDIIETQVVPILRRHAAAGRANLRLEDAVLEKEMAIDMLVDVITERGYTVTACCDELIVPMRVDPQTHSIVNATRRFWVLETRFRTHSIRR